MNTPNYTPPGTPSKVRYWQFADTPGWTFQNTTSDYCRDTTIQWTGCKSDRSVHPAELRVINHGKGKILLGDYGPGHLPGIHEYGPTMEALVLNFIEWAKQN